MNPRANASGVTIVELMTVLIVLGILITLVAPSMRGAIARHRVEAVNTELLTDLQLARSELAQQNDGRTLVAVSFGENGQVTCYTVHTVAVAASGVACDCTRAPGDACSPFGPEPREIKTMQFDRLAGPTVFAASPAGPRIVFAPPQGQATPDGLVIDVQDVRGGQLRTTVSGRGVPSVCSPDGSIRGVPTPC